VGGLGFTLKEACIAISPVSKPSPVQRLKTLNTLLTAINPRSAEEAMEIRKAVEFFLEEIQKNSESESKFPSFAKEILTIHSEENGKNGLCFWDVNVEEKDPLWMRSTFINKLETIRDFDRATFVIYGLRETVFENQKYWTKKTENQYCEIRGYLEEIAVEWQDNGKTLNLIYI
jgi:hypothetical protein